MSSLNALSAVIKEGYEIKGVSCFSFIPSFWYYVYHRIVFVVPLMIKTII